MEEKEVNQVKEDEIKKEDFMSQFALHYFKESAPWIKFISIVGFVACGFMIYACIKLLFLTSTIEMNAMQQHVFLAFRMYVVIFCFILAVVAFFPNLYLFKYANKLIQLEDLKDYDTLESIYTLHNRFWAYIGVLTIIYALFLGLGIIKEIVEIIISFFN